MAIYEVLHWPLYYQYFFIFIFNSFLTCLVPWGFLQLGDIRCLSSQRLLLHSRLLSTPLASFPGIHLVSAFSATLHFLCHALKIVFLLHIHSVYTFPNVITPFASDTNCTSSIILSYTLIFTRKSTSCPNLTVWTSSTTASCQHSQTKSNFECPYLHSLGHFTVSTFHLIYIFLYFFIYISWTSQILPNEIIHK